MPQYAFDLALPPVFSEGNFFVSACNEEAHRWIMAWPNWPAHALILFGPKGAGKSHLGHIWAHRAGASIIEANELSEPQAARLLVENIERANERALLHLLNYTRESGGALLLTSSVAPRELPFTLPDLTSRLSALPVAKIHEADDEALMGAMRKQFADRQMKVAGEVIEYLLPRIERSFSKAGELVDALDKSALAERKNLTIPFVKRALNF